MKAAYVTERGVMYAEPAEVGFAELLRESPSKKVHLILTSPPFPLNRKKAYGNVQGEDYIEWLAGFAPLFREVLADDGSIVLELGNSWEPGKPVMSTLAMRALLEFLDRGNFLLSQQFVSHNPARLPSPAQWVNVERIRLKDSFTHVWWMSMSERPKADNRKVLKQYSPAMQKLLKSGKYNHGKRPSEHVIGKTSFLRDNNGAIPSNVLTFTNTSASDPYRKYCRDKNIKPHPARMPFGMAEFFIQLLTDPEDLVLDPFSGSNTTGAAAEMLSRNWISFEPELEYVESSVGWFTDPTCLLKQGNY